MIDSILQKFPQYADMPDEQLMASIHAAYYPDMTREEFDNALSAQPNHENLDGAAVTGQDSLDLQNMDPSIKPAVKMTLKEFTKLYKDEPNKMGIVMPGSAYIIDITVLNPHDALDAIIQGDDSAILGYPQKGDRHAAVTKQGDVLTHIPTMNRHAMAGNLAWAANGSHPELSDKAARIADTIRKNIPARPA